MDEFEKEYFEALRPIAKNFNNKRNELAKSRIKMFVAALAAQSQEFDLIIGAGNSGLFMTKITEMAYLALGENVPIIVNLPINRVFDKNKKPVSGTYDDKSLEELKNFNFSNILFVDDEIMWGVTAKTAFDMIFLANPSITHINATIIAENHFFEWRFLESRISLRFFGYSRLIQGLNGNISRIVPDDFFTEIKSALPEIESPNHALAIVLGGGIKKLEENKPYFDFEIEKSLKEKIPDYQNKKEAVVREMEALVNQGINGYKSGEIKFSF